jgi:hypothetical protein
MASGRLTIKLTEEQQNQIKMASGKLITELNIDLATTDTLSEEDLDKLSGGALEEATKGMVSPGPVTVTSPCKRTNG